jgi:predicted PurR-regulated permease PerM
MNQTQLNPAVRTAIEISIYLLLILALVTWCLQIVMPFVSFLVWGTIIAVAIYRPYLRLCAALGERRKLALAIFVVLGMTIIVVPAWMFAGSLVESGTNLKASVESGQLAIPPPGESVKEWPIVGERLYSGWADASTNLTAFLERNREQVRHVAQKVLTNLAGVTLSVLQFLLATVIAAVLLANDQATLRAIQRLFKRLVGNQADEIMELATATIRSVTVGVLGIAFIQAVLGGAGMMVMGIPAAGIWALLILILAIAQLPPLLVLLPAVIYVFSIGDNTTAAVLFTIWSIVVSFLDAVLKPLLLGRGVAAPMPVILLGAIGGMIHSGIVGLFLGAVILALGYKLFVGWLKAGEDAEDAGADEVPVESAP